MTKPSKENTLSPSSRGAPRPARSYDLDSLTDVALGVFREQGYDATSMADLAKAAGLTKAAFYYWVSGKEELLERGLTRGLDQLFAVLRDPRAQTGRHAERIDFIISEAVRVALRNLPEMSVLLRVRGNTEVERAAIDRRRAFTQRFAALIEEGVTAGDLSADVDPQLAARMMLGTINSVIEWVKPSHNDEAVVAQLRHVLLEGILPR
jgi:AcrR family transcriptional regulator